MNRLFSAPFVPGLILLTVAVLGGGCTKAESGGKQPADVDLPHIDLPTVEASTTVADPAFKLGELPTSEAAVLKALETAGFDLRPTHHRVGLTGERNYVSPSGGIVSFQVVDGKLRGVIVVALLSTGRPDFNRAVEIAEVVATAILGISREKARTSLAEAIKHLNHNPPKRSMLLDTDKKNVKVRVSTDESKGFVFAFAAVEPA